MGDNFFNLCFPSILAKIGDDRQVLEVKGASAFVMFMIYNLKQIHVGLFVR